MRFALYFLFSLFICSSSFFAVSTKYINDFKFENIENFEFSNVSFINDSGIELSRDHSDIFTSAETFWSMEKWKNGFLTGSGDTAILYFINSQTNYRIFTSPSQILFSDIQVIGNNIYVSAIPKASIFILDGSFSLKKEIHLSNQYIWQILPDKSGYYAFTGNPAMIYYFNNNDEMIWNLEVPGEKNILKGLIAGDDLFFFGDGCILYKTRIKTDRKPIAVASFDNNISDFIYTKGKIYIITSVKEIQKQSQSQSSTPSTDDDSPAASRNNQSDKRSSRTTGNKSSLFSCDLQGNLVTLFEKNNIKFLSLTEFEGSIIIGCDKYAGYFEVSPDDNVNKFTSLGHGKFIRFVSSDKETYGILLEPSRIIKLNSSISKEGYFISSAFDTGNISQWGSPFISINKPPATSVDLSTRSGAVYNDELWNDWFPVKEVISSPQGRFIQYKVSLKSDGKKNPIFRSIFIPYIQRNIAPDIDKISISYNNNIVKAGWDAADANKDILVFDLYLSKDNGAWIKINEKPLEDSNYDLNKENLPDGIYRLKVYASDERSNPDESVKQSYKISDYFIIDNTPPVIGEISLKKGEKKYILQFSASDDLSQLYEADYCVNGGKWIKISPVDKIFDSQKENFDIQFDLPLPATIQVKVMDIFGNYSEKGVYLDK